MISLARVIAALAIAGAALQLCGCDLSSLDRRIDRAGEGSLGASIELLPFSDDTATAPASLLARLDKAGQGTRRRSLPDGDRALIVRALLGECSHCSDDEIKAIVGVILTRARERHRSIADVLLARSDKGTWQFTAFDPRFHSVDNVWTVGRRSRAWARLEGLTDDVWQGDRGATRAFKSYWHPAAMQPTGTIPRWGKGKAATKIGGAMFIR